MQILNRASQSFPSSLEASQLLLQRVDEEIREIAREHNKAGDGRLNGPLLVKINALEERRKKLAFHVSILTDQLVQAREAKAHETVRAKRAAPEKFPLPKKHSALVKAETAIEAAIAKVDAAHQALRKFAATEHTDLQKAGERAQLLQMAYRLSTQDHVTASLALTRERETWHVACAAALESEFKAREAKAHEHLDAIEDLLHPLRSRTFGMMERLRALRKVIR